MNEYIKQAQDFLAKTKSTLTITKYPENVAPEANWSPSGYAYKVTLECNGRKYSFDFWDSLANKQEGKRPTAYDVLACLSADAATDYDNVDNLAEEFGYTKPSEAIRVFEGIKKQIAGVESLYSPDEIELLREIQ